jgi:G:T/U-mismatch repair DNA glycosylase
MAKKLRRVCFNGKTAGKREPEFAALGYETLVLPSSSPAYTMRFEEKLKQWKKIAAPARDGRGGIAAQRASRNAAHATARSC